VKLLVLTRTDISEERVVSNVRVTRIVELAVIGSRNTVLRILGNANVVPSLTILVTLTMEAISSSEISFLARAARRNIPEDGHFSYGSVFVVFTPGSNLVFIFVRGLFYPRFIVWLEGQKIQ
jgi:hypothetical protein